MLNNSMTDMNFKHWLLVEMPINKLELMGKWAPNDRPRGYNQQDIGILTNPKGVEKIHKVWSNTKQKFDIYFIRSPKAQKYTQVGITTSQWIKEAIGVDIQPNPDSITVVFTQNKGVEKIPMTGWAMAHRLGHALVYDATNSRYNPGPLAEFFEQVDKDFARLTSQLFPNSQPDEYGRYANPNAVKPIHLAYAVGTMKSARERNLFRVQEFAFELFAQYLLTGKVKFNPLPRNILRTNQMAWGRPAPRTNWIRDEATFNKVQNEIENLPYHYEDMLELALADLEGKIIVM
jgi:hypothetical protein